MDPVAAGRGDLAAGEVVVVDAVAGVVLAGVAAADATKIRNRQIAEDPAGPRSN